MQVTMGRRWHRRLFVVAAVVVFARCQYIAAPLRVTPSPSSNDSPTSTPTPAANDALVAQADRYLDRWATLVATSPADAIVFVGDLGQGGGWNGTNGNDLKIAFMSGLLIASPPLSAQLPALGTVSWADGATQPVSLISAAEALTGLQAEGDGGKCDSCTPIVVTGATLTEREAQTSRGPARVPVWQFEFSPADAPVDPISYVAVKDAIHSPPDWTTEAGQPFADRIDGAYGNAGDTRLTVVFTGSPYSGDKPCGADYTAEAVESEVALVVIVREHAFPVSAVCAAVGALRTAVAGLERPLGERTILDAQIGQPVALSSGPPPNDPTQP